jgi:hypothetical protein
MQNRQGGEVKTREYNIGDTAYVVRHCPYWPSEEEKAALEAKGRAAIEEAYHREQEELFDSLSRAVAFARKAAKKSFWGLAEIYEARLTNPYREDGISDERIKRSALVWEEIDGGYKCEIEK